MKNLIMIKRRALCFLVFTLMLGISFSVIGYGDRLTEPLPESAIPEKSGDECSPFFTYVLVRIDITEGDIPLPREVEIIGGNPGNWMDVIMSRDKLFELSNADLNYSVLIWDVNAYSQSVKGSYHTFVEMEGILQNIANNYPDITSLYSIGTSYEGRDIWCLEISDNPGTDEGEPGVFYMGLHHAREWPTLEICLYIAENLTSNYGSDYNITDVINNRRLWLVPCVNPDGYHYDHDQGHDWRKNRHFFPEFGTYGVDLNRNYGGTSNGNIWGAWGSIGTGSVTHKPSGSTYCGPGPLSELETQAIRDIFLQNDICASISWHTYSELVLWPWGYSLSDHTPDDTYMSQVGQQIASRITRQSGSGTYTPQQSAGLYPTTGDTTDWAYGYGHYVQGRPTFVYTIEACSSFHPSASYLDQVCNENFDGALYLLQEAENIRDVIPRVIPPEINEMSTDFDGDYTVSWNEKNPDANPDYFQLDELTGLSLINDDVESGSGLWTLNGFSISTSESHSSSHSYKSRYSNEDCSSMTSNYPVPVTEGMNLSFWCWYDIEDNYDAAFVEVSREDRAYNLLDKFTGSSSGWIYKEYSLSDYINESIFIRLRYTTDTNTLNDGIYFDDISPVPDFASINMLSNSITDNFYDITGNQEGIYYYRVNGYNAEHGWGDFSTLKKINVTQRSIWITEIEATPQIQETSGWVNISCNVTAVGEIGIVKANVTYPDGTFINQTMTNSVETNYYYLNNTYFPSGRYSFYIWAEDTETNHSVSETYYFYIGVDVVDIPLTIGWNQITIPVENNWMASSLGENITGCTQVSYWNNTSSTYQDWLVDFPDPEDDYSIEDGRSYFVYVSTDSVMQVYGDPVVSVSVPLGIGWNMIGWYEENSAMASSLGENITGCTQVSYWNNTLGVYQDWLVDFPDPEDDYSIHQGMGFFVYTDETSVWYGEG